MVGINPAWHRPHRMRVPELAAALVVVMVEPVVVLAAVPVVAQVAELAEELAVAQVAELAVAQAVVPVAAQVRQPRPW